ncbi:MAG TPA: hypothetical protein VMA31_11325 [Bryobacteraceae bacterium]|nr:hypothetical protein [Bryobacteraceae bacterium]
MTRLGLVFLLSTAAAAQVLPPEQLAALQWRGIGPAATGGRIADIAASRLPGEPAQVYIAVSTGGIFKSSNEGVSFAPVFDQSGGMQSIGAIAVAPSNPSIVWAGGGEADNRQSSSWGDGVYKSADGGGHWERMGLEETRHIGRIVIDPADPNTVYVAAVGHLWGPNPERGVFKTTDGGSTWQKVLYKDENTGATDLAMDPRDPQRIFAALYQRQRKNWGFNGGGPGSGIYRTNDGGATWAEVTNGLPAGDKGRIGLAVSADGAVVYAVVEAQSGGGVYRSRDGGDTWEHMNSLDPRPMYFSRLYVDPGNSERLYMMGSNRGFYISEDGGRNFFDIFSHVHSEDHAMWIDPANTNHLIIGGDGGVSISFDRGRTWLFRTNLPIGQFYSVDANQADPFLVCGGLQDNGSWCTPSATHMDYGISFKDAFNVGAGDGMQTDFEGGGRTLLVEAQNGILGRVDLASMERQSLGPVEPAQRGASGYRWNWTSPLVVSALDPKTIYAGANVLFRSDDRGVSWRAISPDLTAAIDRETLEMMGGRVPAQALSRNDGVVSFGTLTAIGESPLDRNLLYTGADDGTLERTRDGGRHWTNLTASLLRAGLPPHLVISSVTASRFAAGRVYATVDGHSNDDYHPYVLVSDNYGDTWRPITAGFPQTSVHRLREHPANGNVLVAGLETGVYVSLDRGGHWTSLGADLPPAPVYDLVFAQGGNALVAGTHGRSIWVLDNVGALAEMTPAMAGGAPHLFPVLATHRELIYGGQYWFGAGEFFARNPPSGAVMTYYLPKETAQGVQIVIRDAAGEVVRTLHGPGHAGLNRTCWDLRRYPADSDGTAAAEGTCAAPANNNPGFSRAANGLGPIVPPGKYKAALEWQSQPSREITVLPDPAFPLSDADRSARETALMRAYNLQRQLRPARETTRLLTERLGILSGPVRAIGATAPAAATSFENLSMEVSRAQNLSYNAMNGAARAQTAIDSYAGVPTAAQLRELDWAWEDAQAAVAALNHVIESMPALEKAAGMTGSGQAWRPVSLTP